MFASRLHILEVSSKTESTEWSETMIKEELGQFVHKILIIDGRAIVVMKSISAGMSFFKETQFWKLLVVWKVSRKIVKLQCCS